MDKEKRYVITGGPCSGKTTLINELEKVGYNVSHEVAREILIKKPGIKLECLEEEIWNIQRQREEQYQGKTTFFDRSLLDVIAYSIIFLKNIPDYTREINLQNRYKKIFVLDRLSFKKDDIRYETVEQAEEIHKKIIEIYSNFGYKIENVPVMPTEKRINYLLDKIK
jgi:predicted ATPase